MLFTTKLYVRINFFKLNFLLKLVSYNVTFYLHLIKLFQTRYNSGRIYLSKLEKVNTKTICEVFSKLTIERTRTMSLMLIWFLPVSSLLTLNRFHILVLYFSCLFWTDKCQVGRIKDDSLNFRGNLTLLKINLFLFIFPAITFIYSLTICHI